MLALGRDTTISHRAIPAPQTQYEKALFDSLCEHGHVGIQRAKQLRV